MTRWQDRHNVILAVYILFQKANKVLLLKRFNTGYRDGDYSLPSGHVEPGELALLAAIREAKEEVGVDIKAQNLELVHTLHRSEKLEGYHEYLDLYFVASTWDGEINNAEPQKCSGLFWADGKMPPRNVVPEVRQALTMIANRIPYSELS